MNELRVITPVSTLNEKRPTVYCEKHSFFTAYAESLQEVLAAADWTNVLELANVVFMARENGKKVFICGNGGSAANADHLANDFIYAMAKSTGAGIDAVSLCSNSAVLSCLANDVGYEEVFSEQLAVSAKPGDVLIVLSGSGNSSNVVRALEMGKNLSLTTASVVGFDGGKCKQLADLPIHFAVNDMQISEDLQLVVGHMLMKWMQRKIQTSAV